MANDTKAWLMRAGLLVCSLGLALPAWAANDNNFPTATPDTTVIKAYGDDARGFWSVKYHHEFLADLSYSTRPLSLSTGGLEGTLYVNPSHAEAVLAEAKAQNFDKLPEKILPTICAMHGPMVRIEIRMQGRMHSVQAYWPGYMPQSPELSRFWAVWDKIWTPFALAPNILNRHLSADAPRPGHVYCEDQLLK